MSDRQAVTPSVRIGIDLGGTKIERIALSPAGEEIARRRVTTPRDYAASLHAIATLAAMREPGGQNSGAWKQDWNEASM